MMALLVLILVFVMVKLDSASQAQNEALSDLAKTEKMAKRITTLKRVWDKPKATKKELSQLLKARPLKGAQIIRKNQRGAVSLKAKSLNTYQMGYLLSKLFNGTYIIKSYRLKRLSEEKASLEMEISL